MNNVTVIHVVRRYGPVGGMEKYVWELTHGLMERGAHIAVVCESVLAEPDQRIQVEKIGEGIPVKPRWKSMLRFQNAAQQVIVEKFSQSNSIVHSHERSVNHHVSTFHGPPFAGRDQSFLAKAINFLSPRRRAWLSMEHNELLGPSVKAVIPVSEIVRSELMSLYPSLADKLIFVGWPGVHPPNGCTLTKRGMAVGEKIRFLFVGKEWKRKGLDAAIELVSFWRDEKKDESTLDVFGPSADELPRHLRSLDWVRIRGFDETIPWKKFDVLVHLAVKEPFGMVVSEARSQGLFVLVSEAVGARYLQFRQMAVMPINASVRDAMLHLGRLLYEQKVDVGAEVKWTWDQLCRLHIEKIYPAVRSEMSRNSI